MFFGSIAYFPVPTSHDKIFLTKEGTHFNIWLYFVYKKDIVPNNKKIRTIHFLFLLLKTFSLQLTPYSSFIYVYVYVRAVENSQSAGWQQYKLHRVRRSFEYCHSSSLFESQRVSKTIKKRSAYFTKLFAENTILLNFERTFLLAVKL